MVKAFGFTSYGLSPTETFLDVTMPVASEGQLVVEVSAAGVNPVDWKIRSGMMQAMMPLELPAVLGAELSGVVRELGPGVEEFAIGDEVFGNATGGTGGFAEFALMSVSATAIKPADVSFVDAATLAVAAATAYDGVTELNLKAGQTLLISGASGGVGAAATQIARDLGIVAVGVAGTNNQEFVESLGAIFVAHGDGLLARLEYEVPDGVDAIFDLAGGNGLHTVADLLDDRTKLITAGDPATAAQLGGHMITRDGTSKVLTIVANMVASGALVTNVEKVFAFENCAAALGAVESDHVRGKVVIEVSATSPAPASAP